ncbi:hypothetical protein BDQ17DRAFT_152899 [Cyathus striatus]|nr:hypothetical protein BDQ17DRAFT_152899 [Cyathus striatus]
MSFSFQYFIMVTVLVLGLANKPTTYHPLFFILALAILISMLAILYPDEGPETKYHLGTGSVLLGTALDFLVLSNSQETARRKGDVQPASQRSFLSRVKWAAGLLCNPQSMNWTTYYTSLVVRFYHDTPSSSRASSFQAPIVPQATGLCSGTHIL